MIIICLARSLDSLKKEIGKGLAESRFGRKKGHISYGIYKPIALQPNQPHSFFVSIKKPLAQLPNQTEPN